MRVSILNRYVLKEIIPSYFLGVSFLSIIMFVIELFKMISLFVEQNASFWHIAQLLLLYLPLILQFTIPVGVIIGVILAVGRLSDDQELIAMVSCGVSLRRVFSTALFFGACVTVFTLLFYEYLFFHVVERYAHVKLELFQSNPTAELANNFSYKTSNGIKVTIGTVTPGSNELGQVHIYYLDQNKIIFAPKALLLSFDAKRNAFPLVVVNSTLQPGNLKQHPSNFYEQFSARQILYIPSDFSDVIAPFKYQDLPLSSLAINVDNRFVEHSFYVLDQINELVLVTIGYHSKKRALDTFVASHAQDDVQNSPVYQEELFQHTLQLKKAQIAQRRFENQIKYHIQSGGELIIRSVSYIFHRKLVFATSAFVFALLAAPLGVFSKRAGKSISLGISILLIILFFGLVFLGEFLVQKEVFSSQFAAWYVNIIFGGMGLLFFAQRLSGKESWTSFLKNIFVKRQPYSDF